MATTPPRKFTRQQVIQLKVRALKLWKADKSHAEELGKALLAVKTAVGHGKFREWWQAVGLVQSRVSYCMRLAQGKVAAAKAKKQSARRQKVGRATQVVAARLHQLFRWCSLPDRRSPDLPIIHAKFHDAIGVIFAQAGQLAGWRIDTPEVKRAADELKKSTETLLGAMARPRAAAASSGA